MQKLTIVAIILPLLFALSACKPDSDPAPTTAAPSPTAAASTFPKEEAEKLIRQLATQGGAKDSTAEMRLSFTDADGKPQQMDFRLQRKYEGNKVSTLMTVLAPKEESEKALLVFEEEGKPTDAISYLAGLKKITHLKSDSPLNFRGSKSTVQEMLGLELNQYEVKEVKADNPDSLKITLQEKPGLSLAVPRIDTFISAKMTAHVLDEQGKFKGIPAAFAPDQFDLYDVKGQLLKKMKVAQTKNFSVSKDKSYQALTRIEIEDVQRNQKLKLEIRSIKYDTNLPSSLFTEANLIKVVTAASQRAIQ